MTMKRRESEDFSEATILLRSCDDVDVDHFYDSYEHRVGATATGLFLLSLAAPPS